jgi:hypothetical protein
MFRGHLQDYFGDLCYHDNFVLALSSKSGQAFQFSHTGFIGAGSGGGNICVSRVDDWIVIAKSDALANAAGDLGAGARVTPKADSSRDLGALWNEIKANLGDVKDVVKVVGPPL